MKLGGTIISGHLHNQNNRVTIIRHGSFAVTLERKSIDNKDQKLTPRYYIDSQVCKGVVVGTDLYIESQLKHKKSADSIDREDMAKVKLTLLNVSKENDTQLSKKRHNQSLRPKSKEVAEFYIN